MADKVQSGQPIPRSASLWNNIIGSANEYALRQLGQPGAQVVGQTNTEIVVIKNSSGAHVRLGEVLEISGFLVTSVERNGLWFDGDEPDATRPFVVALQDMPTSAIDRAQVSGVCVALVNVTDAGHGYAVVADGEPVAQSAESGPIRILYKPTGTGEKVCAVLIGVSAAAVQKKPQCRFTLNASMAKTAATKAATIVAQLGYGTSHASTSITVSNPADATNGDYTYYGASGASGWAFYDEAGDDWWIYDMDCPAA